MSLLSSILIVVLILCNPISAAAQSSKSNILEGGTSVVLRTTENLKASSSADNGVIAAVVDNDVYSADGTQILIKKNTPAQIEFNAEPNGSWGKAGKVCFTGATTKTIDNKRVSLRLSSCKNGGSKLGGVIVLSVLFFPIGLVSGCMKGSMPKIPNGTTFNGVVSQDITCTLVTE